MTDPIGEIEARQGQIDMGRMTANIFTGARAESGSLLIAFWATAAWVVGMVRATEEGDG